LQASKRVHLKARKGGSITEFEPAQNSYTETKNISIVLRLTAWLPFVGNYQTFLHSFAIDRAELFDVFAGT